MEEKSLWCVKRVTADEYKALVPDRKVFFNEPDFIEINKAKADEVYYLIFMPSTAPGIKRRLHKHVVTE